MNHRVNLLLERARRITRANPRSLLVVVKEMLHQEILGCIAESQLSKKLVFQGGTSLRLCHGNPRYSEDLDFARRLTDTGTCSLDNEGFEDFKDILLRTMQSRYGLDVEIKEPKQSLDVRSVDGSIAVHRWVAKINVQSPMDNSVQRVHIEVADVPAYNPVLKPVQNFHDYGGSAPFYLQVSSTDEILCDKIVAVADRKYLKPRDLWDIHFLLSRNTPLKAAWIRMKAFDYRMDSDPTCPNTLAKLAGRIDEIRLPATQKAFVEEMSRFAYGAVGAQLMDDPAFSHQMLTEVADYLGRVHASLTKSLALEADSHNGPSL